MELKSDWAAGGVGGSIGLERSVAYCAVVAEAAQRSGFNCRPRPLPAGRPSGSPAPRNTPRRSSPGTGSGAAVSHRCVGSVPHLGRSVDKYPGINL